MVRNEEQTIRHTLRTLEGAVALPALFEVILVDSGCTDQTINEARKIARELSFAMKFCAASAQGRGAALDAGTSLARGDIIFVCHADCIVPSSFDDAIRKGLSRSGVLATAFRFRLNRAELVAAGEHLPGAAVMEWTVYLRSRALQLPFGDQGLALPATTLRQLGGWGGAAFPLLEDMQLVNALRIEGARGGGRIAILGGLPCSGAAGAILCSPRRWRKLGVWRVNLVNQLVMLWYQRGATPRQLFDFYYGVRTEHVPAWLTCLTAPLMGT